MPDSLSEICTPHVIVVFNLGGRDRDRLRFATEVVEAALSGDEQAQDKICIRLRKSLNAKGGHYGYIVWNPAMLVEFFEDRHDLPTEEEIAEAKFLFDADKYYTPPVLTDDKIGCECVPARLSN